MHVAAVEVFGESDRTMGGSLFRKSLQARRIGRDVL
jgi:hypothetical protein